jgi:hypothetical protein
MVKKVGQRVLIRAGASYDISSGSCDNPNSRGTKSDIIVKVMSHGVRTRNSGYISNKRIINIIE